MREVRPRDALIVLSALLAGCQEPEPARQSAQEDARDIAMVEAAQDRHPPVRPLALDPVNFAEIDRAGMAGAGCAFLPDSRAGEDTVFVATSDSALLKMAGGLVTLAADTGSAEYPYGTRKKYTGKAMWIELAKGDGEGQPAGEEAVRWPGTLTVRDQWDRIIYQQPGSLDCGA